MSAGVFAIAAVGAAWAYLHAQGTSNINHVDLTNQVVATSLFQALRTCSGSQTSDQFLSVTCGNDGGSGPFAENRGCRRCIDVHTQFELNQNLYEAEVAQNNPGYTPQSVLDLTPELRFRWRDLENICESVCRDCVVKDVEQTTSFEAKLECFTTDSFQQDFRSQIQASVESLLKNKQDFLGAAGDLFTTNVNELTTNYANEVANEFETRISDIVQSDLSAIQSIQLGVGDNNHSFYVQGLSQSVQVNGIVSSISKTNFVNNITDVTQFNATLSLLNSNDTTGDLANAALSTLDSLADIWEGVVGKVLIIVSVVMIGMILVVGGIMIIKPKETQDLFQSMARKQ